MARGNKKDEKDPNKPKKPTTAFMYFSNAMRERVKTQNPGLKMTDIASVLGKLWGQLPEADKDKYQTMANSDKERYAKAMDGYVAPVSTGGKSGKKSKDPNAPKRPPSAYICFANAVRPELRKTYPSDTMPAISTKIGELWRQLTDDNKEPYNKQAEALKLKFQTEMAAYKGGKGVAADESDEEDDGEEEEEDE
ncbi:hypothetical protein CAOG_02944 [Capsaspora owczarzaki ATCC 30864]|uniref:HMG box domain-containing protein n=1 Tax=Capsaspora owczarzaki (strain ATCC 30864) TaxID=595528 RepID=A0A0D2X237_CAPO3|nr:hypothetical protein CAOG_02944 [Capsaspora owczarzaki ATCC 30864]KJE91879.1 hypothetical protein CAOG_002944 [Capsaspora owczarzaki ATCC 30864]|eukprot:XP_004363783.1 hypothetical protein CAOG_02944 [Capsaspora owczarzaki ATCC 30864]